MFGPQKHHFLISDDFCLMQREKMFKNQYFRCRLIKFDSIMLKLFLKLAS